MSTDPQDPQDPQDPADPPAPPPIAPPARTEPPEPAERPESGGDDLSDPTFELELDSAITEEVAALMENAMVWPEFAPIWNTRLLYEPSIKF